MNHTLPLLFAAPGWEEIFSIFAAIVFFVVWLVNQINDARKQQKAQEKAPVDPPQHADQAPAPKPVPQAAQADPLRAQVDEFLRRAGKQPGGQQAAQQRKPPAGREEIVVLLDDSVAAEPRQKTIERKQLPSATHAARARRSSVGPPPASTTPPRRRGGKQRPQSVSEYVSAHVGGATQQFVEEVADLGQSVKQADELFDRQLHAKFDHELGSLGGRSDASDQSPTPAAPTPASDIAAMLSSPTGVRQAIVLNEILRRPTDRW